MEGTFLGVPRPHIKNLEPDAVQTLEDISNDEVGPDILKALKHFPGRLKRGIKKK